MKIKVNGDTPMERLANLTRGILAVPKIDVERADKKWQRKRAKKRKRST